MVISTLNIQHENPCAYSITSSPTGVPKQLVEMHLPHLLGEDLESPSIPAPWDPASVQEPKDTTRSDVFKNLTQTMAENKLKEMW